MAFLYDQLMKEAPYDQWLAFTQAMIRKSGKSIESIADLGCGTGEITIKLASEGYQLFGVDYSAEMLTYAEQKARTKNVQVNWLHQDLRELQGLTNLDAVISYCDVINYITSESELRNVFQRIARSLKVGGLLMFDIHSVDYVTNHLINHSFTEVRDDMAYIWECIEGENHGEMFHDLTFFIREDEKYHRMNEYHHQYTYPIEVYKSILTEAGFENPVLYSDFSIENEKRSKKAERIFFVTEKKAEKI